MTTFEQHFELLSEGWGLRACYLVHQGSIVAALPSRTEGSIGKAWSRVKLAGEVLSLFLQIDDEVWIYLEQGDLAALAVAEARPRSGILTSFVQEMLLDPDVEKMAIEIAAQP